LDFVCFIPSGQLSNFFAHFISHVQTPKKNKMKSPPKRRKNPNSFQKPSLAIPRMMSTKIVPPRREVILGYPSTFINTAAAIVFNKRFNPNAAEAPEVGSATKPNGYATLATQYNQYRVLSYSYKFELANLEAFPVYVYAQNSNTDPGTSSQVSAIGRSNTQYRMLGSKTGQDRCVLKGGYTVQHIVGETASYATVYKALGNAVPADLTWLAFGTQTSTGANLSNGVAFIGQIFMRVVFFDPLPL